MHAQLKMVRKKGGIEVVENLNRKKSEILYSEIDSDDVFSGFANVDDRSIMNVTFNLNDEKHKDIFDKMLIENNISGLNGHRSVGGYRASIYNAMDISSVEILIDTIKKFKKLHMIVLANDGISQVGVEKLENNGFKVITTNVAQDQIIDYINRNSITCLLVRSATKVRKDIIDSCESLKLIGRGGVGMDNIDVEYAKSKGIRVINTPGASSLSVAELVFAHIMTCSRFLHDSNRNMPLEGDVNFKKLKKLFQGFRIKK